MDASKDLMNVTHNFLSRGVVKGAACLPIDQLVELLNQCVATAASQLRYVTMPSVLGQIAERSEGLPTGWGERRAVLVYAKGSDAWNDTEAEYWFVDRDKVWYWIKNDRFGRNLEFAQVTSGHLVERQVESASDSVATIRILGSVARSFEKLYSDAAITVRKRASDFDEVASKMSALDQTVRQIRDPSPS